MRVNEVITTACNYMHVPLDSSLQADSTSSDAQLLLDSQLATDMLFGMNMVMSELATVLPMVDMVSVTATNGIINYSDISDKLIEVSVVRKNNRSVPFQSLADRLVVDCSGSVDVVFSQHYGQCSWFGTLPIANGRVDARMLAYALCYEYCIIRGDYDNAYMWRQRFTDSMERIITPSKAIYTTLRRWY